MALPDFNFKPSFAYDLTRNPQTSGLQLGDGYVSLKPLGMRPMVRTYSVEFNIRDLAETREIDRFLTERGGYRNFKWTPPDPDSAAGFWVCQVWNVRRISRGPLFNISATFQEV